jgi:hypothetical protein
MAGKKIKLDEEAISEILVAATTFFSQKGTNMRKQLFSS